jgi:uncharacterized protein RhaS with RHS repeats
LYYYRARYYSPQLQRFISEDPIGFTAGDINLYAYVQNNPTNYIDPEGFSPVGWVIRLTESGYQKARALFSKADAVRARRQEENVLAKNRQMAHEIENANSGGKGIVRHPGHQLDESSRGMPHYQTPGKLGHTFWSLAAFLASLFNPFDAIGGELSGGEGDMLTDQVLKSPWEGGMLADQLGCRKPPCE